MAFHSVCIYNTHYVFKVGRPPIYYACAQGHIPLVTTLVEEYNVDPSSKDYVRKILVKL